MLSHRDERVLVCAGFAAQFAREPTRPEAQCVQAIGWLESNYGAGLRGNQGAIQAGPSWHGATFDHIDTHPNADGTSTTYTTKFRLYGTAADAVRDLVHVVYQDPKWGAAALAAARAGDTLGFSRALYHGGVMGYYEGFGTTPDVRIERHHHSVQNACILQAHALGEVMPDGSDPPAPPRPMIQIGSTGPLVADVQRWAHVDPDGDFGPITKHAVQLAQLAVHLKPDGRVGPQTWAAIDAAA